MNIRNKLAFTLLFLLMLAPPNGSHAGEKLELWVHPYLPATMIISKFSPLANYLSENSECNIEIKVSRSYADHIKRVGEGRFDLAYLGPSPYIQVTKTYGSQTLLACLEVNGKPFFHGMIIARKDSPLEKIKDLAGKSFAFGDPNSTMSHLLPRNVLGQHGVPVEKLSRFEFLGSHHDVALGVLGGYYDAGAVKEGVYLKYKDRGLKILAKTPPITEHLFIANNDLPKETVDTIRNLLINLKDKEILTSIKNTVTGMVIVRDEDYDTLRNILQWSDKMIE